MNKKKSWLWIIDGVPQTVHYYPNRGVYSWDGHKEVSPEYMLKAELNGRLGDRIPLF